MRKAIANAPYYRTQVKGFRAGTYLKGTGKMKTIPAILKLSKEVRKESKELLGKLFVMEEQRVVTFKASLYLGESGKGLFQFFSGRDGGQNWSDYNQLLRTCYF